MKIPKLALKKKILKKAWAWNVFLHLWNFHFISLWARSGWREPSGHSHPTPTNRKHCPGPPARAPLWWVSQLCQPGLAGPHRKWEVEGYTSPTLDPFRSMPPVAGSSWKPHTYSANKTTYLVKYTVRAGSPLRQFYRGVVSITMAATHHNGSCPVPGIPWSAPYT